MNVTLKLFDLYAISPLLILVMGAFILVLVETFAEKFSEKYACALTIVILLVSLLFVYLAPYSNSPFFTAWLKFDSLSIFFNTFFLSVGLAVCLLSATYFQQFKSSQGEFYFLLLSSVFGLMLVGSSADFLTLFLGLETLSISLYVMCGYMKMWENSGEASMKYFFMGSIAAAFLLYGIALIYGAVGITRFDTLLSSYNGITDSSSTALFLFGIAFVTLGIAFKAAVVPFHTWAPDVYDGSPTPVTAFLAVGSKAGAFAAFIRLFLETLPEFDILWNEGIALLAYPTLIYANFTAMRQTQLRRFFAYSGISHSGFLLMALASGTEESFVAIQYYLVIYALSTMGAFAVLELLDTKKEGVFIADLNGLFRRDPLIAGILAISLLTLAGIPPTAGFLAKFYLFKIAFQSGYHVLVIVALIMTVAAVLYYTRILAVMFSKSTEGGVSARFSWPAVTLGMISFGGIFVLSCFPSLLFSILG